MKAGAFKPNLTGSTEILRIVERSSLPTSCSLVTALIISP